MDMGHLEAGDARARHVLKPVRGARLVQSLRRGVDGRGAGKQRTRQVSVVTKIDGGIITTNDGNRGRGVWQ